MVSENFYPEKALQITRIIYFSMITASLAFLVLVFRINSSTILFKPDLTDPLIVSILILCCTTIPFGFFYSRKTCNKIDPSYTLVKKYSIYQTGLIVKLSTCEGITLIATGLFLFTNNLFFVIIFLIALTIMIAYYPTPEKIRKEIKLTQSEAGLFN